jgi:hypothetical protein
MRGVEDEKSAEMQRIVTGPDPDRVRCILVVDYVDRDDDIFDVFL